MAKESKKPANGIRWRLWLGVAAAAGVCASTAVAARRVHQYVITDPQFVLSRERRDAVELEGIVYTSRAKVQRVFANDFDRSVFAIPLAERRRRLLAIDWVEDASVSRIWPDRLVVRIRERRPVAFVNLRGGFLLIDRYGVFLEQPAQAARIAFPVLRGIQEDQSEAQRAAQVSLMLRVLDELGANAKDISEINTADFENLRLIAQTGGNPVELIMGDSNYARRYRNFLSHYAEIHKRSPNVKTFDLRLENRILTKE
jgi:cell division protein FtsQ